jgi:HAD superfamily hydrolase (TIGR01548 family)
VDGNPALLVTLIVSILCTSISPLSVPMSRPNYTTLLLDMDGVLAEVSKSYRAAIIETCHKFGAKSVTADTVVEWKVRGNANDDWKLSYDLILDDPEGQKDVTLERVTEVFEEFYQGHGDTPGLYTLETLIPKRETLQELKKRSKPGIGIVTGRPRKDCMKFLQQHGLEDLISATYCMEDGPSKPDPFPVRRCCELLGVDPSESVVLVGDTPDDIKASLAAGCRAVGVVTPEAMEEYAAKGEPYTNSVLALAMSKAGADKVLPPGFSELVDMFAES